MAAEDLQLEFGDGQYLFKMTVHGLKEVQEKCGAGIGAVWSRLAASRLNHIGVDAGHPEDARFRIEDIIEPIRQGLIGGGQGEVDGVPVKVTPMTANRLVDLYVINRPLQEGWAIAYAIMGRLVEGAPSPELDKKKSQTR